MSKADCLNEIFNSFCVRTNDESQENKMDLIKFQKFVQEYELIDQSLSLDDAEEIFIESKENPLSRKINFTDFKNKALNKISTKKSMDIEDLNSLIIKKYKNNLREAKTERERNSNKTFEHEIAGKI